MAVASNSFVSPSSLSLPSPSASDSASCPSRKRPRNDLSPEDRREARAHRNRIAAQNSRDKRKAQFSHLQRRVSELEEENRRLRAGIEASEQPHTDKQNPWEKENNELKDRIKTLENGWDAVVKALAAQGLTTGITVPPQLTSPPSPSESESSASSTTTTTMNTNTTATFPVLVPSTTTTFAPLSPAPSHSSITGGDHRGISPLDVPAAGGLDLISHHHTLANDPAIYAEPASPAVNDAALEDLLREILAPSPSLPTASLPVHAEPSSVASSPATMTTGTDGMDWACENELQRILDMLPGVQQDRDLTPDVMDFPSHLDLNFSTIGVF